MKQDKPVVDCSNGWSKAALRLLVLLIPYWLLWCPAYMIWAMGDEYNKWYGEHWFGIPLIVLFPFSFFLCSLSSYLVINNRLSIKDNKIFLPAPKFGSYPADSLTSVALERSLDGNKITSIVLNFDLTAAQSQNVLQNGATTDTPKPGQKLPTQATPKSFCESISVSRLKGKKATKLLQLLERSCPKCTIDNETKTFLQGHHAQQRLQSAVETEDKLEMSYHSHERAKNFIALIKSYESYFWKVYLTVCAIPLLVMAPLPIWLVPAAICKIQGVPPPAAPEWYGTWFRFFSDLVGVVVRLLQHPVEDYFKQMTQPMVVITLSAVVIVLLHRLLRFFMQPNKLTLDKDGMSLRHIFRGACLSRKQVKWSEFSRVTLQKPKGTTAPEQWFVSFHRTNGKKPFNLSFAAIKGDYDREQFLANIEKHAQHLTRDHELIEVFKPAQKQSYTELWLQSLTTPPKRERLAPLIPGQVLKSGRYTITEQLGTGGQGIAYLGTSTDSSLSPRIVVKEFVLPVFVDKSARRQALEKFEREAVLLQGLSHPRVVQLLDYFIEDHRGYLVLEHINGASLRRIVEEQGPLDQQRVVELAKQMCDILQYLHALQPPLVHRDFTPDNLILNADGVLKLIDFNVAHQKESHTTATVVGKHAYLPPEQFRGKPVPQSDIYALGASLHFLLTGQDPEPVSVAHPILLLDSVDSRLDEIIARSTELDTKQRYSSASELLQDLRIFSGEDPIPDLVSQPDGDDVVISVSTEQELVEELIDG